MKAAVLFLICLNSEAIFFSITLKQTNKKKSVILLLKILCENLHFYNCHEVSRKRMSDKKQP